MLFRLGYEMTGLLCLWIALKYQKRGFQDIGFSLPMRVAEVGHSFALFFGAWLLGIVVGLAVFALYRALGHPGHRGFDMAAIFGSHITLLTVMFIWLNPFFEELLVRAFLITEMEQIYQSTTLAVFVSVVLQASYHLYQGLPAALIHASTFLMFSIYFIRRRRILPIIMAHLYMDVIGLAFYARYLGKH